MMPGPPPPFEVLSYRNMLTEWQPGFFVIFVSHQWLGRDHPDEEGHVCHCLRMALQNIMTESLVVDYDPLAKSLGFRADDDGLPVDGLDVPPTRPPR